MGLLSKVREYREELVGCDDLLNYAFLSRGEHTHEPAIVLLKDGALLRAWYFQGPDLDYAAEEELERLSLLVANAFRHCGDGWMLHVHSVRRPCPGYMPPGAFPDATSALIDEEGRRRYAGDGHYDSVAALALTYKPPSELEQRVSRLFYEGRHRTVAGLHQSVDFFIKTTGEIEDLLVGVLNLSPMDAADLTTYLHTCATGVDQPMRAPAPGAELDVVVADQDLIGGFTPKIGQLHMRVVSIDGFPGMTQPGAQTFLHELAIPYHWSTRFVFLDTLTAQRQINKKRRNWRQQWHKFGGKTAEAMHGEESGNLQLHPVHMTHDALEAAAEAASGDVVYGYYTMTVTVFHEDERTATEYAKLVQKTVRNRGFGARIEEANALEAFLGSLPGHGYENLRGVLIHSLNLADLLPLTSVWVGQSTVPNPYFPAQSPALMLTATAGHTPFFVTPWVGDVGMMLVLGPVGSGKSTLLNMLAAQFLRYPDAQVFWFDKDYSAYVLCQAVGGHLYDIGGEGERIAFTPLAGIESEEERVWAWGWLEECLSQQGVHVTPEQRKEIWAALQKMGHAPGDRTLTAFRATVQDLGVRTGLAHYALGGGAGELLDAAADSLRAHHFMVFEMSHLLARGDTDLVPVLLYLFHRIEQRLDGRPTLIPIDEAWMMVLRSAFGQKIEAWLRTLRKKNAAVIFTSQSLTDVERCPQRNIIVESCQTKIFLPNAEARTTQSAQLYLDMGINHREIELLAAATPKKHYLYHSPLGRRLFDMNLGRAALSLVGMGGREDIRRVRACVQEFGEHWPAQWLRKQGCEAEARWWEQRNTYLHHTEDGYVSVFRDRGTASDGITPTR
jgi:type IV secretion system protein TrbE